jgi:hypothetical protein
MALLIIIIIIIIIATTTTTTTTTSLSKQGRLKRRIGDFKDGSAVLSTDGTRLAAAFGNELQPPNHYRTRSLRFSMFSRLMNGSRASFGFAQSRMTAVSGT